MLFNDIITHNFDNGNNKFKNKMKIIQKHMNFVLLFF